MLYYEHFGPDEFFFYIIRSPLYFFSGKYKLSAAPNLCGCIIFPKMICFVQTVVCSTFKPGIKHTVLIYLPTLGKFYLSIYVGDSPSMKNKCGTAGSSTFLHRCAGRWGDREKQSEVNGDKWRVAGTGSVHVLYNCEKTNILPVGLNAAKPPKRAAAPKVSWFKGSLSGPEGHLIWLTYKCMSITGQRRLFQPPAKLTKKSWKNSK